MDEQKIAHESRPLEKFQTREWKAGDIYAPHDLSPSQMKKWKERHAPPTDVFESLNLNPLNLYKVCEIWTSNAKAIAAEQKNSLLRKTRS